MKEKEDFINASETAEQFEAEIDDTYDTFLSDTLKAGKNSNNQDMAEFLVESAEGSQELGGRPRNQINRSRKEGWVISGEKLYIGRRRQSFRGIIRSAG